MNLPLHTDYIDIHTHGAKPSAGIFIVENLMAHEEKAPGDVPESACTFGVHPWYLTDKNCELLLNRVNAATGFANLIAIGEAGFDKLRGPVVALQRRAFEVQITIAEEIEKPVVIHCVRAWDELLAEHKKFHPKMPWLVHGFRGNKNLAAQLLSKGIYLSFWYDFVSRSGAAELLKTLPENRIFLETDGADVNIRTIYKKVASDLNLSVDELKSTIFTNFREFFKL